MTDVSTTWAEVIFRVKRIVFVRRRLVKNEFIFYQRNSQLFKNLLSSPMGLKRAQAKDATTAFNSK